MELMIFQALGKALNILVLIVVPANIYLAHSLTKICFFSVDELAIRALHLLY